MNGWQKYLVKQPIFADDKMKIKNGNAHSLYGVVLPEYCRNTAMRPRPKIETNGQEHGAGGGSSLFKKID